MPCMIVSGKIPRFVDVYILKLTDLGLVPGSRVTLPETLGSLSKSLRLALIRLPEVNFPKNETLRMHAGCIQP